MIKKLVQINQKKRTYGQFLWGVFSAIYQIVVEQMPLPDETRELLGALVVLCTAGGFATSVGVRCVCLLLIPTFLGKAGRSYIGTFAIAFLIAGMNFIDISKKNPDLVYSMILVCLSLKLYDCLPYNHYLVL
mgnify:CR=1 FL=1